MNGFMRSLFSSRLSQHLHRESRNAGGGSSSGGGVNKGNDGIASCSVSPPKMEAKRSSEETSARLVFVRDVLLRLTLDFFFTD
jgi:hypothetical protein